MRYFALAFVFLSLLTRIVHAQTQTFSWSISLGFGQCELIPTTLAPLTKTSSFDGVSPFYMISYELGGIATTDFIGMEWQNLTWPVRHPQGAQVFLNVVDSLGNSGGILSGIVQGGATSDCLPPKPTSPMKVVADLPQVETCDSVNATITGGRKPYTISIVSTTNYRAPSNFTIGEDDDVFTYVDRVAPGDSFIITASDTLGQWAYGTNFISSVGSNDTSCPGEQSFGSQSTNSTQSSSTSSASTQNNKTSTRLSTAAIVGIAAGGATLLVSLGLAVFFFMRRRRNSSATNRSIFLQSGPGDITPFVSPPVSEPRSRPQMGQPGTHSPMRGNATDYSSVPLLRTPRPRSRQRASHSPVSQPTIPTNTTGQSDPGLGSAYGNYLDPFAPMIDPDSRRTSSNTIHWQSAEDTAWLHLQSPMPDSRPVSVLPFPEGSTSLSSTRTTKQRLSGQAARQPERGTRTTVFQHRDSEDLHLNMNLIEVPPVYRERARVGLPKWF